MFLENSVNRHTDSTRKNSGQSIFEVAAGKSFHKKNQPPVSKLVQPTMEKTFSVEAPPASNEDIMQRWERCKVMYRDLSRQIDALFSTTTVTPQQLSRFLSDRSHFSSEQWAALEEMKKQNTEKFTDICRKLPEGAEKAIEQYVRAEALHDKKAEVVPKKSGGKRKKILPKYKWLEMH